MLKKCEPPPEQWVWYSLFWWWFTFYMHVVRNSPRRSSLHTLQLNVSTVVGNTGTAGQLWVFLSGWMVKCSGARGVTHEGFYQGEWWSAMEHEESAMSVFIRVNGEVQWSTRSHPWGFLSGWMVKCNGAWGVSHECFYQGEWWSAVEHEESPMRVFIRVNGEVQWSMMSQPWGFLSGWLGRCSGAWVTHEGYQGEWCSVVESTMKVFIRVNEEVQWSMMSQPWGFLSGWMGRCSGVRQQWKSTGSGNSGNVLDQATAEKYRISAHCSCTASETLDLLPLKRSVGQQR